MGFFSDLFSGGIGSVVSDLIGGDSGGGGGQIGGLISKLLAQVQANNPQEQAGPPPVDAFGNPQLPELTGGVGQQFIPFEDIQSLSTFRTPDILRQLLSRSRAPGGFLAPGQQQRSFGIEARGIVGQLAGQRRDLRGDLRGLNPSFANRAGSTLDFNALRDILSARSRAEEASSERNFLADQGFANALAATDVAQKQQTLQALQFNADISSQLKASRIGARAATTGALIGGGVQLGLGALEEFGI